MAEDSDSVTRVSRASKSLASMLEPAKIGFQKDHEAFVSSPGKFLGKKQKKTYKKEDIFFIIICYDLRSMHSILGGAIPLYETLLRDSGAEDFESLNKTWESQCGQDKTLREELEKLWDIEEQWDQFLTDVDKVRT